MGLFSSLNWFKSQTQKEKEELELQAAKLQVSILEKQNVALDAPKEATIKALPAHEEPKAYKRIKLVNDQLTIVLNDGNIISKASATQEDFVKARNAKTEAELFVIVRPPEAILQDRKEIEAIAKMEALNKGLEVIKDMDDFHLENGSVYMVGADGDVIERSMPQLLVEKFITLVTSLKEENININDSEEYQALKKFWLKCCLNPNAQSAEDLYTFLSHHNFKIDRHGNFYAYRRVVSLENGGNKELVDFISNAYNKIKGVWKKKPADYNVIYHEKEGHSFVKIGDIREEGRTLVGNLQELYLNLPNMQEKMFTSAHTRQEDYRVGEIISMPRDNGDDNNNISCSKGFHAASKAYNYSGFGDTPILVIINPMDVLAVPLGEVGKLRTCRWFFAMTLPEDEQYILDDSSFDTMTLGDVFEEKCFENLEAYVKNSFVEEVKRHTFTIPQMSANQLNNIILSLEDMKSSLAKRVVEFN